MSSKVKLNEFDATVGLVRGASKQKEILWYLVKMLFFLTAFPFPSRFKVFLLKLFGAKLGSGVVIKPRVSFLFPWKLEIGNDVWIGEEVLILNFEKVKIGDNVCISQRTFLCGGNHDHSIPSMPYRNGPIFLKDGCWIGAGCFVGPGVIIGTDTVVTAGSIVSKSIDSNGIYSGNPLTFIKKRWRD